VGVGGWKRSDDIISPIVVVLSVYCIDSEVVDGIMELMARST